MTTPFQFVFEAIGTHWIIDGYDVPDTVDQVQVLAAVMKRIDTFDKTYSRFRSDSLITRLTQKAGTYRFPPDFEPLLELYRQLYDVSDGAFTPLIGKVMEEAGYDAEYSLKAKELHQPPKWSDVIEYQPPDLTVKQPAVLDFGAAGKGYLIDLVGQVLRDHDVLSFCIDAGGDLLHSTQKNQPLRVGLEHPEHTDQVIGIIELQNQSLCGSAGNRRKWPGFHHIIHPFELKSPEHLLAVWVIADSTLLADGLSTALFLTSAKKLQQRFDFEYLLLKADHTVERSTGFAAELFAA